jgi:transmembrane sensor
MSKERAGRITVAQRRHEAVEWFVEHESGRELTQERLQEWEAWIVDAPNRREYAAIVDVRRVVASVSRPLEPSDEELLEDSIEVQGADPLVDVAHDCRPARSRRFFLGSRSIAKLATPLAITAFSAAAIVLLTIYGPLRAFFESERLYLTGPGEQRQFTLSDGSILTLGGDTAVRVHFSASGRIVLLSRGEGMFRVQHDKARPFMVCAAEACTTAVGTIFDVRLYSNHVRVAVQEGTVEVAPFKPDALNVDLAGEVAEWAPIRVTHGEEMNYTTKGAASAPKHADTVVAGAWTEGSLIYHGRPLAEVIEDVQRYSPRPVLLDPAVADLQYSGSVLQTHVEEWIRGLPEVFPVKVIDCRAASRASGQATSTPVTPACAHNSDRILVKSR